MYNNIESLISDNENLSDMYDEFCPQFSNFDEAMEYARSTSNNDDFRKAKPACTTDSKGNVLVFGDVWTMAVIPICVNGQNRYEVVKAAYVHKNPPMPCDGYTRVHILPSFEAFQNVPLTDKEQQRLSDIEADTDGNIYQGGTLIKQHRSYTIAGRPYFQMQVNLKIHDVQTHRVSHIIWAALNNISYDIVKLMISHIVTFCPEYLNTTNQHQLDILELRNAGWQWSIDHINSNPADNSICNLQMCTLQSNIKLRDIRIGLYKQSIIL